MRKAELEDGVRADPLVQAVLARFPGAEIVGVRAAADAARRAGDCRLFPRTVAILRTMRSTSARAARTCSADGIEQL